MQFTFKNALKVIAMPAALLVIYFSLEALWRFFGLPPEDELVKTFSTFIDRYGLLIVFAAALIEGLLLIGNYFPGGVVVFLGVFTAAGDISRATEAVLVATVALFIAYAVDYYLGMYGWYKLFTKFGLQSTLDSMQKKLSHHVFTVILSSYWLPNLAAACATAAGIMHVPAKKFLIQSAVGLLVWDTFWGVLAYTTGDALLKLNLTYILLIFVVWCALILIKVFIFDKRFNSGTDVTSGDSSA